MFSTYTFFTVICNFGYKVFGHQPHNIATISNFVVRINVRKCKSLCNGFDDILLWVSAHN